jgi:hypothetical protein
MVDEYMKLTGPIVYNIKSSFGHRIWYAFNKYLKVALYLDDSVHMDTLAWPSWTKF